MSAGIIVVAAWRRRLSLPTRAAVLAAATVVAAPLVLLYDLMLAAVAAAWLVRDRNSPAASGLGDGIAGGDLPGAARRPHAGRAVARAGLSARRDRRARDRRRPGLARAAHAGPAPAADYCGSRISSRS